jgi:glycosyltransferase involved in cell wall biosynthesis
MSQGRSRRVLIVGDSPLIQTGFGRVNNIAAKRFQEEGYEVASVAGLTAEPPKDDQGIKIYVPEHNGDMLGIRSMPKAVEDFKPDVVYSTADPGSIVALAYGLPEMPIFVYTPIEGEPIANRDWRLALMTMPLATTSKYGADLIKSTVRREVPYIYHGVNHDVFKVTGIRDEIRKQFHWEDKFVITCVSTNVRRKQLPRLMEAVSILKHQYKQKDIVLYMHTVPFQNYWLEGWNLLEVAAMYGIAEETVWNPLMAKFGSSIAERTGEVKSPGVADIIEGADLFVMPSQVEGFCLPAAEAMACGVPVMITKYAAGWEIVQPAGRGIPIKDWEVHKSGTMYANVDPQALAKEILRLKRSPKELERMRQAGLVRAQDFQWSKFTEALIPSVEKSIESFTPSSPATEREDQVQEEGEEEVDLRTATGEASAEESADIPQGQGEDVTSQESQD